MARLLFKLLVIQTLILFAALNAASQVVPIRDQKLRVVEYSGDLLAFLTHIPGAFDTTVGFEVDALEPRSQVTFGVRDAKLADVMDALVRAKPRYSWRSVGNAIEVFPTQRANPLLETQINSFEANDLTANEAMRGLLTTNEVQQAMVASRVQFAPADEPQVPGRRITINLKGLRLREALDRIAEQSNLRFWVFQTTGPSRDFFSIRFYSQN